jgi:ABC-2 type transport system permease protein
MNQVSAMLGTKLRIFRHQIASIRDESYLKVGVVTVAALLLWLGAFFAFFEGFEFIQKVLLDEQTGAALGEIVMARLLSVFALALFFMLTFSNILIAFSTMYRAKEVVYLVHTPVTYRAFFIARFVECVWFSSWATAFLGSPLMLAYGLTTGASPVFYVAAIAFYLPYVTIPAAIGTCLTMVMVRIFPKTPRGGLIGAAVLAVGLLFLFARSRFDPDRLAGDESDLIATAVSAMSQTQSAFFPSHWAAHGILLSAQSSYAESLFYFLLLLSNALMAVLVATVLAERLFYAGWSDLWGNEARGIREAGKGILSRVDPLLRPLRNPARSLIAKDIKLFWRDPTQWTQFVIFFGIMALYVGNLRNTSSTFDKEMFRTFVICLNIGACTLILATLTSRFVFPMISLEGRRFWVLGLAPITFRQIVWQKFALSVVTSAAFTVGVAILSCIRLEVGPVQFFLSVYSVLLATLGLSGLAVGLGSLYPNFEEDNPARIVSGMGGTLNFLLSMAYISLLVGSQTVVMLLNAMKIFDSPLQYGLALIGALVFATVLTAASVAIPMRLGLRNLTLAEY